MQPEPPSPSVLLRARGGCPLAWGRLVSLWAPVVDRWCRQAGLQAADVDNVVQDVAVMLPRALNGFHGGSFRAWLRTVTRTRIIDHHRRQRRQPVGMGGDSHQERLEQKPAPDEESLCPDDTADALLWRRALELVRGEFEQTTWQAFWRSVVDGHATADVAAALGISSKTVRSYKSRVLNRLKEEFGELLE